MRPVRHISIALGLADEARQALGSAEPGDDAELDLGLAEARGIGGEDEVAHHRQLAPAAERVAGDGGDDRLAAAEEGLRLGRQEILAEHIHEPLGLHVLDVGAGREGLLVAGQDHRADGLVAIERAERGAELAHQLRIQGVEHVGAIEGDQPHPVAGFDADGRIGHGSLLSGWPRAAGGVSGGVMAKRTTTPPSLSLMTRESASRARSKRSTTAPPARPAGLGRPAELGQGLAVERRHRGG